MIPLSLLKNYTICLFPCRIAYTRQFLFSTLLYGNLSPKSAIARNKFISSLRMALKTLSVVVVKTPPLSCNISATDYFLNRLKCTRFTGRKTEQNVPLYRLY